MDEMVDVGFDLRQRSRIAQVKLAEVFKPRKQNVDPVCVVRELAAWIEQCLEKLVIRRKPYVEVSVEFLSPEQKGWPQRIRGESRGNRETEWGRLLSR